MFVLPLQIKPGGYTDTLLIITGFIVILIHGKASVRTGISLQDKGSRIARRAVCIDFFRHGNDGTGFSENRQGVNIPVHIHHPAAFINNSAEEVHIHPFRKPYLLLCHIQRRQPGGGDRRCNQLGAEIKFIGHLISLLGSGILIIHGQNQRNILGMGPVIHGVQIRKQLMAQAEEFIHHAADLLLVTPGLLTVKFIFGTVEPVYRRKDSELEPAAGHFIILKSIHMSADIMAPPAIADIRGRAGKIRLESKRFPGYHRISGKTYRISVRAGPCIAGKGHRAFSIPRTVQKMKMVQHPQRIQSFHFGDAALLPVKPPEIHTLFLIGMMGILEISRKKCRIRYFKGNRFFPGNILSQLSGHSLIHFLMSPDTIRRMHIQRNPHSSLMEVIHKPFRIREKFFIPCIAGPAGAIFRIDIHQMPVHIDNGNGKRNPFLIKTVHQLQIAFLGIFIITAPPVAQSIPGKHGCLAAKIIKILQTFQKVQAISPEINILYPLFPGTYPAFLGQDQRGGIIQNRKAVSGNQTGTQFTGAVNGIQGSGRTFQIMDRIPVMPYIISRTGIPRYMNPKPPGIKFFFIIGKSEPPCQDFQLLRSILHLIIHCGKISVDNSLCGPILKNTVFTVLQADQSLCEHCNTVILTLNDISAVRRGPHRQLN